MSELLLENGEFYNPNFSPSLRQLGWIEFRSKLRPWRFHDKGVPAPTLDGLNAAYWLSSVCSKDNELPVLAITHSDGHETPTIESNVWFAGVVSVSFVAEFEEDTMGLHRACIGSTLAGPSKLGNVLEIFDRSVTAESVILPENVEQFSELLNKN